MAQTALITKLATGLWHEDLFWFRLVQVAYLRTQFSRRKCLLRNKLHIEKWIDFLLSNDSVNSCLLKLDFNQSVHRNRVYMRSRLRRPHRIPHNQKQIFNLVSFNWILRTNGINIGANLNPITLTKHRSQNSKQFSFWASDYIIFFVFLFHGFGLLILIESLFITWCAHHASFQCVQFTLRMCSLSLSVSLQFSRRKRLKSLRWDIVSGTKLLKLV